jgi:hypothetical protein
VKIILHFNHCIMQLAEKLRDSEKALEKAMREIQSLQQHQQHHHFYEKDRKHPLKSSLPAVNNHNPNHHTVKSTDSHIMRDTLSRPSTSHSVNHRPLSAEPMLRSVSEDPDSASNNNNITTSAIRQNARTAKLSAALNGYNPATVDKYPMPSTALLLHLQQQQQQQQESAPPLQFTPRDIQKLKQYIYMSHPHSSNVPASSSAEYSCISPYSNVRPNSRQHRNISFGALHHYLNKTAGAVAGTSTGTSHLQTL